MAAGRYLENGYDVSNPPSVIRFWQHLVASIDGHCPFLADCHYGE